MLKMPTLDLGELGTQIDAALRDEAPQEAPAPEAQAETLVPGADEAESTPEAAEEGEPAADAGDDFEAKFQERFQKEYQERSREDIRKLQSKLDRQIAEHRRRGDELAAQGDEANAFADYVLGQLQEYDPELARNLLASRERARTQIARDRELKALKTERVEQARQAYYAEHFPYLDPADPRLREPFERGDDAGERRAIETLAKLHRLEHGRKPEAPQSPKPEAQPQRNEKGQFISQQVAATKAREQARGPVPVGSGGVVPDQIPMDKDQRVALLTRQIEALGLR